MKKYTIYEVLILGTVEVPDDITEESVFPYMDAHEWPDDEEVIDHYARLVDPATGEVIPHP